MDNILNLTFASSLEDLCQVNSSFDSGILRIAYTGENKNKTFISKETFEKSIPSIYNCPVVCNYDVETDELGGHDMDLVCSDDGTMRLINMTEPVGVIPSGAKVFWEDVEEDDGTIHEYLCAEALIWKRQAAYKKIKQDGITAQSMEIKVKAGETVDDIYHINDFEFTAFALIGVEPCFESASLTFAKDNFKKQFSEMMRDLKQEMSAAATGGAFNIQKFSTEGGMPEMDKKELLEKYGINADSLNFSIDELTYEELEEKLKAIKDAGSKKDSVNFELTENIIDEVIKSLSEVKRSYTGWDGETREGTRYYYVDTDLSLSEVYCWDAEDWLLYGFKYTNNGDNIVIDFESKTRKKYAIVDFDEGETQDSPFASVFSEMSQEIADGAKEMASLNEKYTSISDQYSALQDEVGELRKYKADTEDAIQREEAVEKIKSVFSKFDDLIGVEAFENLKSECEEDCHKYDSDTLEEKCFAIRGRQGVLQQFSNNEKQHTIIKIPRGDEKKEPYNGVFEEFGFTGAE